MKQISAILALVFLGWAANAQSTDNNNNSDTTHRHHAHRNWDRAGNADKNRGETMNRFDHREGMDRSHFGNRNRFGRNMHELHFTPEQRKQMQAINMDYRKKSSDLYKNDNLTLREYKSQLLALQKDKKSKMQNLLTPEQKNKMVEFKKKRSENMQVMAAAHLERMKINLILSDQQAATIKSQQQNLRAQMQSIRENDNLMRDQKMEQIKALLAKQKDAIKSVLTPEQQSQFENMHKQRFGAK
jgi:Spy/CpxP family protein refolding chaperone